MAVLILLCAYVRSQFVALPQHGSLSDNEPGEGAHRLERLPSFPRAIRTAGHESKRLIGPPFVSAGRVVVLVALVVAATEVTLAFLIFRL